jgi:mRNA interferase MazF
VVIRRGQIYYATLDPTRGREQAGRRPVLVVSDDAINELPLVVTVIAGTSGANIANDYPTNVRVTGKESGLPRDTVFMAFQIRTVDASRLLELAGALSDAKMCEVDSALRKVLSL